MLKRSNRSKAQILHILHKEKRNITDIPPLPSSKEIYQQEDTLLEVIFARELQRLGGNFIHCKDETDAFHNLQKLLQWKNWNRLYSQDKYILSLIAKIPFNIPLYPTLQTADVALTTCTMLIARTGSIVMDTQLSDRTSAVVAPNHICFAYTNQIVADIANGLNYYHQNNTQRPLPSLISLISGPSKTADIEKTLVKGVHGPKQVFCFLIDEKNTLE